MTSPNKIPITYTIFPSRSALCCECMCVCEKVWENTMATTSKMMMWTTALNSETHFSSVSLSTPHAFCFLLARLPILYVYWCCVLLIQSKIGYFTDFWRNNINENIKQPRGYIVYFLCVSLSRNKKKNHTFAYDNNGTNMPYTHNHCSATKFMAHHKPTKYDHIQQIW